MESKKPIISRLDTGHYEGYYNGVIFELIRIEGVVSLDQKPWMWKLKDNPLMNWEYTKSSAIISAMESINNLIQIKS